MEWDINKGPYVYHGLALDTKPQVKHMVKLNKAGHEFDIEIISYERDIFQGKIIRVGPQAAIAACGLKRGDVVSFQENNIQRLSCSE